MQVQIKHMGKKDTQTYSHLQMPYMDVQILSQIKEKTCKHIFKNNYKRYLFYKFAKKKHGARYAGNSNANCQHQHCILYMVGLSGPAVIRQTYTATYVFFLRVFHAIKGKRISLIPFTYPLLYRDDRADDDHKGKKSCTGKRSHQLCGFGLIILKRNFFIASAKLVKPSWLTIPARTYIICITYVLYYICIVLYCICIVFCIT